MGYSAGRANGDDHKVAAPPGMSLPAVAMPLAMPRSAWACFSHTIDQKEKLSVSPCAKFKNLQPSSFGFLLVCNLCEEIISSNTSGQKGKTGFGQLKQKVLGQEKSQMLL